MLTRQQIEKAGYRELVADHCELVERVTKLEQLFAEMAQRLAPQPEPRTTSEVVADYGHDWRWMKSAFNGCGRD